MDHVDYRVPEDKWYKFKGVKPPERQPHGVTEDNVEELIAKAGDHKHVWVQKGPFIECDKGSHVHGHKIGVNKRLTGTTDNGLPILVDM